MKKKIKKIFHVIMAFFLACIMFVRCTLLSASAVITEATVIISATKFISDIALAVALKDKESDNNKNVGSVYADSVAVDYSKKSNDTIYTCPVYSLYGKSRLDYTNGNYEVVSLHINIASFSSFYVNQPADYSPSDYPLYANNFPSCGTAVFIRTAYSSDGTIIYSYNFEYVYDVMPTVILYNQSNSLGYRPNANGRGVYYKSNGDSISYSSLSNERYFKVSATNSIVLRSGLDWDSRYSDDSFLSGSYSLNTYFVTEVYSNDTNFINNVDNRYNSLNYGTGFKPVLKKIGIEAKTTINNTNINNYSDYGLTYTNNEYIFNHTTYENNFNSVDIPSIKRTWNDLYISQPDVGFSFDSDIRYNYVDLSVEPINNNYLPSEWLEAYPAIQTNPNIEINSVPVPTETIPPDLSGKMVAISQKGFDLFNSFGLAVPLIAITVFGIVYKRFID